MWRACIALLVLLAACEFPVAPWGMLVTCDPLHRDTVWVVIETEWMRTHVGRCQHIRCDIGDSVRFLNPVGCRARTLPEGRPYR